MRSSFIIPSVVMASDDVGSRLSFMIVPNTKRHPNNTKTDQLPIFEVITGLPRPYHNNNPWQTYRSPLKISQKIPDGHGPWETSLLPHLVVTTLSLLVVIKQYKNNKRQAQAVGNG